MGVICPKDSCNKEFDTERGMKIHHARQHGEKISYQDVECYWCGETVRKRDSEVYRNDKHFCDAECKQKEFSSRQAGEDNPRWEEDKEKNEHTCEMCGELYKNYKKEDETVCCSKECYAEFLSENRSGENAYQWKGGKYHYYGPSWKSSRRKALENANYKCEECEMSNQKHKDLYCQSLHVHHIEKFRKFGLEAHEEANKQENLMAVCRDCHYRIEP